MLISCFKQPQPASITWNGNTGFTGPIDHDWSKSDFKSLWMESNLGTCVLHNLNSKSKWIYLGLYKWAMNMHFHTSFDDNGPMYPCILPMLKQPQMGMSIISPFRCPIVSSLDTTCCTH
jgi:hypothetical protein